VIVGASIHMSKHEEYVRDFVKRNREDLEEWPSAFFSVTLAAQEDTDEARTPASSVPFSSGIRCSLP
jgi:menaquinone-dependent protoporphyrinogen oxidase